MLLQVSFVRTLVRAGPCILRVLWKHKVNASALCDDVCTVDWWVEWSADNEGVIDDSDPISIEFESALDSCPIEVDHISDDLIKFNRLTGAVPHGPSVLRFIPTWHFDDPCFPPFNFNSDVAWFASSYVDFQIGAKPSSLSYFVLLKFSSHFMKISFHSCSSYTSPHLTAFTASSSSYYCRVLSVGWVNIMISPSVFTLLLSVA